MKNIALILLLSGFLFGAIPTSGGGQSSVIGDTRSAVYVEPTLNKSGSMDAYQQKVTASSDAIKSQIVGGTAKSGDSFFELITAASCSPDALKCPPLKAQYQGGSYVTMINYINPAEGKVGCTVYDTSNDIFEVRNGDDLGTPVISEVITVRACQKHFSPENNRVEDQSTSQLRDIANNRSKQLNSITSNYNTATEKGQVQFMDLGDWLDALATVDGSRIDIQSSLSKGQIATTSRYTLTNKGAFLNADANIRDLISKQNPDLTPAQISKVITDTQVMRDRNKNVANSQYIMFLGYFVQADEAINTLLGSMMFIFIIYNAIIQWAGGTLSFKVNNLITGANKQPSGPKENHIHRGLAGLAIIIMFFSGTVEKYDVKDLVTGQVAEQEVKQQRIRDIVRIVFGASNDLSDELARIGIAQYLKYITLTSGISGVDRIDAYTTEKQTLLRENGILHRIESTMCGIYNTQKYKEAVMKKNETMKKLETATTEEVEGLEKIYKELKKAQPQEKDYTAGLDLEVNPFPRTEKIAFQTFSDLDEPLNPYSSEAGIYSGGGTMFMSMSGCYNNRAKILDNNQKIAEAEIEIKKIGEDFKSTMSLDRVRNLYDLMWRNYSELGYISVAFLPATAVLVDSQGVLGDKAKRDSENTATETMDMQIARALPVLALFGGENVKNIVAKTITAPLYALQDTYEKSLLGKALNGIGVGGLVSASATIGIEGFTYYTTYQIINSMLNAVTIIMMVVAGIIAFIMLTLQKLYVFMALPFLAIWAFHQNQDQKILLAVGKMITVSFKTVLLVVSMFLVIFSMSLIDSMEYRLINDFFVVMQSTPTVSIADTLNPFTIVSEWFKSTLQSYLFYGLAHVAFIFVKMYMIFVIVFKLPSYFIEIIDNKTEDLFDKATNNIQDVSEKVTTRGM